MDLQNLYNWIFSRLNKKELSRQNSKDCKLVSNEKQKNTLMAKFVHRYHRKSLFKYNNRIAAFWRKLYITDSIMESIKENMVLS